MIQPIPPTTTPRPKTATSSTSKLSLYITSLYISLSLSFLLTHTLSVFPLSVSTPMGDYSMSPSTLPVHKDGSHTISRTRPKIKIIHIIAPEIIKTDVANFRELVQRLTGKPASTVDVAAPRLEEELKKETIKKRPAPASGRSDFMVQQEKKIKCEVKVEEQGLSDDLGHKELWMDLNPGGFLSFLEEDVFQGMADFLQPLGSSRVDLVGEMYAS